MAARPLGRGRKEVEDPNNTWNMQLMAALLKGDTSEAQTLLSKGAKIDHQASDPATGKQVTPFLAVAQKSPLDLTTLEWIAQLELGPPPSALQPDPNLTPQQNAKAIAAAQAQIITMVAHTPLTKVVNPQYDNNQGTVLHYFVKEEKLEALEKFCANRKKISTELSLDELDASGQSATQLAINLLKPDAAKILIRHGARHPFHSLVDAVHCQTARACISGQTQLLETILQAGDNPHQKDSNGQTLMHLSVSQPAILDILLERGLSINVLNAEGQTPLLYVVQNMPKALDVVDSLVARGADVNIGDRLKVSPLMHSIIAYQPALIKKLIEHKADVNARDQFGGSALHWAVVARQKGALELLLSLEVEVNATDLGGETPLHRACTKGCLSSINILLAREQVDINLSDKQGRTPLHATVEASQLEVLKALAKRCTDESPFAPVNPKDAKKAAPKKGAAQPTEPVIATKLNIEAEDGNGNTALQVAVAKNDTNMVAVLVETGANVRRNCPKGTLLHEAVWSGNLAMVSTLVDSRAIIDARDSDDYSPLHIAAQRGSVDIAEVLLKAGATADLQDFNTLRTALHIAAERKDDEMIGLLVGEFGKANAQLTDASVRTALHSACLTGHTPSIRKLLNAGAIPFRNPDIRGWTPIHAAVSVNCRDAVDWLTTYESVSEGAIQVTTWETYLGDLFAKDDKGWTPLHVACASGANDCVNEIIDLLKGVVRDREERKQVLSRGGLAAKEKEAAAVGNEVRSMHNRVANKKAGETVKSILASEAAAATPYARKNTSNELLEVLSLADNNDRIPFMLAAEYGQSHIARLLVAAKRTELGH